MYLGHGLRQSNSRTEFGRRSRCPKFFARIRPQNFDRCHSFLLASSATGGARKRPPFHKGALGTGDADCCVGPGPPRNDNGFLSFRGQCAHWTWESVLFTMDGGSGRRGRRPLRKAQLTTQASRRAAERPRPRPRGMGGNRRKNHPRRGTAPPRPPGQRLAKRKARKEQLVKFRFCPTTELCSTAY